VSRRPVERIRGTGAPQTARSLLEENKKLVVAKQEKKALDRQDSREFVEKLLVDDRVVNEIDKAKDIGRRTAQRGLAQYYKSKIAEKEAEKSNAYKAKCEGGVDVQYFPFIEGETISQNRQAEAAKMREEMRSFFQQQQRDRPPRRDALMADSDLEYQHRYPFMPVYSQSARGPKPPAEDFLGSGRASGGGSKSASASATPRQGGAVDDADENAPHLARYPKFLSRAREHMSRRIHDAHVRKALEDKVERTKAELEELTRRRQLEAQQWEDGMLVNDALRYDGSRIKQAERQRNAEYLQRQAQDRKEKEQQEREARFAEPAGYWGPDEKVLENTGVFRNHCSDLIKQMEVNQCRKLDSRSRRLQQEKSLVEGCIAEMSADRVKEKEKFYQHREVLLQTWESQRKIKQVMKNIDSL